MTWFKQYTSFIPVRTVTTTTSSVKWETLSPRCFGCKFSYLYGTALVCACPSRTVRHTMDGDECMSYKVVGE